jgi:hypothetical protein
MTEQNVPVVENACCQPKRVMACSCSVAAAKAPATTERNKASTCGPGCCCGANCECSYDETCC